MHEFLWWGYHILFILTQCTDIQNVSDSVNGTCVGPSNSGKSKLLDISCQDNAVISSINVTSGTGHCDNMNSCCTGVTPKLIVDRLTCYWKRSCSIYVPTDIIILADEGSCEGCVGSTPQFLWLKDYRCFQSTSGTGMLVNS